MCVSAMSVCVSWAVSQGAEVKAYPGRAYSPPRLPAMSIDPSILVSIRTSVRVSIHISIHMSIHMSIRMSIHMSIHMSTHMSIADGCYCRTRWHDVNFGYEAPVVFHVKEVEVALVFLAIPPHCASAIADKCFHQGRGADLGRWLVFQPPSAVPLP